ncbi:hypothetical protein Pcinc_022137 [Petrolisthes cinctipes]|uniref:Uncharacterized protein n=1 Tax=Petrolisthes cinctipes TaxID=88211 RepID=A0AAE1FGM6_PETCI|nr:hypothetical protein Pcinc_022137 [Petrolisthes cinctipes]
MIRRTEKRLSSKPLYQQLNGLRKQTEMQYKNIRITPQNETYNPPHLEIKKARRNWKDRGPADKLVNTKEPAPPHPDYQCKDCDRRREPRHASIVHRGKHDTPLSVTQQIQERNVVLEDQ